MKTSPPAAAPPKAEGAGPKAKPSSRAGAPTTPPAIRQYLDQKAAVGDAILLFRMGDFYETFFDDAKTIARVLGLTLTSRDKNSDSPIPLAGVPYHAADRYIARLVQAGYKVAVSEQMEDPKESKGVVKREVVRIITPGTLTEDSLLDERSDSVLAALLPEKGSWTTGRIGLACVSLAGGRFEAQMLPAEALVDELARLRPAEVLIAEHGIDAAGAILDQLRESAGACITARPPHVFDAHMAQRALCEHFAVNSLAGFGFDAFDASLCAAAAILDYLKETQKTALRHILRITPRAADRTVMIDQFTLRSLEVERTLRDGVREGTLLAAVDRTVTPMGARRLRNWLCYPLADIAAIEARLQAITDLRDDPQRLATLRNVLGEMGDLERVLARIGVGRATPRDLVGLGRSLELCDQIAAVIGPSVVPKRENDLLSDIADASRGHEALAQFLSTALKDDAPPIIRDGGFIADGYHAELDRLRNIGQEGHRWLAEYQAREAARAGIPSLKVGYNSVFGYYIEVTHQHRDKVPAEYVRKQTVRNAERYITDELKRHENEVLGAGDRGRQLEIELFEEIRARAATELPRLQAAAESMAILDVLAGLADLSRRRDYCRPEFVEMSKQELEILDGRHPVLDITLAERFVPNSCRLSVDGDGLLVITGPNMAGKSTYIRQIALLTLLAHVGSYVPAKSMRLSPVDRIFARVGANDELARGQSTFMVEMVETARILNNATPRSLVILDEIGRGTSTYDGLAIAWAVTEYLAERVGCRTLFATHYHELTELAGRLRGVANFNVAVREQLRPGGAGREVVFLHTIVPGPTDRSYGVHVAEMAGLPGPVVKRSEKVLHELESSFAGGAKRSVLTAGHREDPDQLMLFSPASELPAWWRELVEALAAVDVDQTTPLDALSALSRLKQIVREQS